MGNDQFSLSFLLKLIDEISTPMVKVGQSFDNLQKKYEEHGAGMRKMGQTMTTGLTLPIVGWGALGVHEASKLGDAFAEMQLKIQQPAAAIENLRTQLLKLSTETPHDPAKLMEIATAGGRAGVTDNLLGFTKMMADLNLVTKGFEGEGGVRAFMQLTQVMGTSRQDYGRMASTLTDLSEHFNTNADDIANFAVQLGGLKTITQTTTPQLLALSAWMGTLGPESAMPMNRIMHDIGEASQGVTEKLGWFSKVSGIGQNEFRQLAQKNAPEALAAFLRGIVNLKDGGVMVTKVLEQMGLDGARTLKLLLPAAQATDKLSKAVRDSDEAWEKQNALQKDAEFLYKTYGNTLLELKNTVMVLAGEFGRALLPALKMLIEIAKPILAAFSVLPDWMKTTIVVILGMVAAMGPLLMMLGMASGGVAVLGSAFSALLPILAVLDVALAPVLAVIAAAAIGWKIGSWINEGINSGGEGGAAHQRVNDIQAAEIALANRTSHEVTVKLGPGLSVGDVNKKEGNARLSVNSEGYTGQFAYGM